MGSRKKCKALLIGHMNERQYVAQVMATLSALFDSSPENSLLPIDKRLAASWNSLIKIHAYEEVGICASHKSTRHL